MKKLTIIFLSGLFLCALPVQTKAAESVVIGEVCQTLGASTMTSDRKNIATCLEQDTGTDKIWKGMTTSNTASPGAFCGLASYSAGTSQVANGYQIIDRIRVTTYATVPYSDFTPIVPCEGVALKYLVCPAGYTFRYISSNTTSYATCTKN